MMKIHSNPPTLYWLYNFKWTLSFLNRGCVHITHVQDNLEVLTTHLHVTYRFTALRVNAARDSAATERFSSCILQGMLDYLHPPHSIGIFQIAINWLWKFVRGKDAKSHFSFGGSADHIIYLNCWNHNILLQPAGIVCCWIHVSSTL